ncbi:MAG: peptidoglycan-binding protein [Actinomycetota bacterium]
MSLITNTEDGQPTPGDELLTASPTGGLPHPGPQPVPLPRQRRPRLLLLGAVGLGVVGAVAAAILLAGSDEPAADTAEQETIRAVTAEQRDLIEYQDLDGTFTYATTSTVRAAGAGTITSVAADGDTLDRGDIVYEIDATPTVLFHGDTPFYRPLVEGDEGDDVLALEENLASLGHHIEEPDEDGDEVDTGFVVDGVFDGPTADAVRRWQADLGLPETGRVELGAATVAAGPVIASSPVVEPGVTVQPGAPILNLSVVGTGDVFYADRSGELIVTAAAGPITSGDVLFTDDGSPVTAIVTDDPFDRDLSLGVEDGDDVLLVEEMLVSLGHDARGDLVPDEEFDELTTEAIEDWEEALQDTWDDDLPVDGILSLDQIVIVPPDAAVETVVARDGDVVATGSALFQWDGDGRQRVVTTAIDVADQDRLVEGESVTIEFPDNTEVTGVVDHIATSTSSDPTQPDAEPQLAVEILVSDVPASIAALNQVDVEVKLVDSLVSDATVVPASALAATADGGYAVEVVDGTTTRFVQVETGKFADGFVEVTGIEPGTAVVVPS